MVRRIKIIPPTPPQKTAIEAIEGLREKEKDGEHQKEYYMRLTDILRTYIAERFGFNAREMTTEEIVAHLRTSGDEKALGELQSILTTADLVKFAKYEASLLESDRNLLQATQYVQTTKIEIPESERVTEKVVLVGNVAKRRIKWTMLAAMAAVFAIGLGVYIYVAYLVWQCFL